MHYIKKSHLIVVLFFVSMSVFGTPKKYRPAKSMGFRNRYIYESSLQQFPDSIARCTQGSCFQLSYPKKHLVVEFDYGIRGVQCLAMAA